jgi:hypothetical protein
MFEEERVKNIERDQLVWTMAASEFSYPAFEENFWVEA